MVETRKKKPGADHLDTLTGVANLALTYGIKADGTLLKS